MKPSLSQSSLLNVQALGFWFLLLKARGIPEERGRGACLPVCASRGAGTFAAPMLPSRRREIPLTRTRRESERNGDGGIRPSYLGVDKKKKKKKGRAPGERDLKMELRVVQGFLVPGKVVRGSFPEKSERRRRDFLGGQREGCDRLCSPARLGQQGCVQCLRQQRNLSEAGGHRTAGTAAEPRSAETLPALARHSFLLGYR